MGVLIRKEHDAHVLTERAVFVLTGELGQCGSMLTNQTGTRLEGDSLGQPWGRG